MLAHPEAVSTEEPDASNPGEEAAPAISVLLVDDQPLITGAVRDMLATEEDIALHVCHDPRQAATLACGLAPSVILLDLAMPHMDGLTLLKRLRSDPATLEIPIIVLSGRNDPTIKACAFTHHADDYLIKLPDRIELIARIRHHSAAYKARLERDRCKMQMALELAQAAKYVRSLLPAPIQNDRLRIDWRFVPSDQLGGDALGYRWLDADHIALYMLDVIGHGVGASLLAVNVLTALSHQTLPDTDFLDPSAVAYALNSVFRMERHGQRFFTIWYGVYDTRQRTLSFSGGGHPQPLLFSDATEPDTKPIALPLCGPPIGVADSAVFQNQTINAPPHSRLLIYSDGVVEVQDPQRSVADQQAFMDFVSLTGPADDLLDLILNRARQIRQSATLDDDCSLVQVDFI
ncbi:MAG TPA: SpoIIE family protein phosphatase [Tepidisphaeraceae bacterium]|nr:SpoIIE family protein phosphatase [Tepidisphaeraceae bacterium]